MKTRVKIDQLAYFVEAAKHEHIGKAAKVLNISPSAISHSISLLEEEYGKELFSKQGKQIVLTHHGKLLLERAKKLIQEMDLLNEDMVSEQIPLRGHYRIAGSHWLTSEFLAPGIANLQNNHAGLTFEIYSLRSAEVLKAVSEGHYDLGLCFSPHSHPDVSSQVIYSGLLLIAVRKKHPLLKIKKEERIKHLCDYKAVLPKSFQGIEVCEAHPIFKKNNIVPQVDCWIDNYQVAMAKVIHSDAWALIPDIVIQDNPSLVCAIDKEDWDASFHLSLIWPKERALNRPLKDLQNEITLLTKKRGKPSGSPLLH